MQAQRRDTERLIGLLFWYINNSLNIKVVIVRERDLFLPRRLIVGERRGLIFVAFL